MNDHFSDTQAIDSLATHLPDGVLVLRGGLIAFANPALHAKLGFPPEMLHGMSLAKLLTSDSCTAVQEFIGHLKSRVGGQASCMAEFVSADGAISVNVLLSGVILDTGKWQECVLLTVKDSPVLDRSLQESERRAKDLEAILENLPDAYYRTDAAGKVIYCTRAAEHIFGLPAEELVGHPLAQFYETPEERAHVVQSILGGKGEYVLVEARMRRADGSTSWASTRARALFDANGAFLGVEGSGRDISKRIHMEQALRESLQKLEMKEQAKSRFLAAASHDLRQPIQAINLFLDALIHTQLDTHQRAIAESLASGVASLSELLDALLNVSRLEAGAVDPHPEPVDIGDLLNSFRNEFEVQAEAKGLVLRWRASGRRSRVFSDRHLLGVILRNLIGNAVKHTKEGKVLVGLRKQGGTEVVQVWDTGPGIEAVHQERIFEEFYQIENLERDRTKGLGLGLAIVRRTAALLGSEVTFCSRPGYWTVFQLRCAAYREELHGDACIETHADCKPADTDSFRGKRFCIVEDDEQLARSLNIWINSLGAEAERYSSSESALSVGTLHRFDYFVVDFRLPGQLNGLNFLEEARRRLGQLPAGVLMTGDTSPSFIAEVKQYPWPVLFKPVTAARLLRGLIEAKGCAECEK